MEAWGWERGLEEREEAALESRQLGLLEGRAGRKLAAGVWLPQEGSSQAGQREQSKEVFRWGLKAENTSVGPEGVEVQEGRSSRGLLEVFLWQHRGEKKGLRRTVVSWRHRDMF